MEIDTLHLLRELDKGFYQSNSASFSKTRQRPWQGWERIVSSLPAEGSMSVLDIACGNMRFERHLEQTRPRVSFDFDCVDICDELIDESFRESYRPLDVIEALEKGVGLGKDGTLYDVAVCFGFMHHVPGSMLRERLLQSILSCVRPGGIAAVSFWEFARDAKKLKQAEEVTTRVESELNIHLGENDYFLGWNDREGAYRYCHSFTPQELDSLVAAASCNGRLEDRYSADGKDGLMNEYMVFRRR